MTRAPGFWDTLWALVPLGLAGTFSWLPVTGVLVLLLAPHGRPRATAFLAGRVVGLAVITLAFVAGARALPPVPRLEGRLVGGTETLIGVALVVVAVLTWRARHHHRTRTTPAWARRLTDASGTWVFLTSVVVDLQPKGLLLGLAAGAVVRGGSLPVIQAALVVLVYLVLASSSVLVPVLATYVAPVRTQRWLRAVQAWLATHGAAGTAVVIAVVGVVLVADAVGRF